MHILKEQMKYMKNLPVVSLLQVMTGSPTSLCLEIILWMWASDLTSCLRSTRSLFHVAITKTLLQWKRWDGVALNLFHRVKSDKLFCVGCFNQITAYHSKSWSLFCLIHRLKGIQHCLNLSVVTNKIQLFVLLLRVSTS